MTATTYQPQAASICIKGSTWTFYTMLYDSNGAPINTPTVAAGDFQTSLDGAAFQNVSTSVSGYWVAVSFTTAQTNGAEIRLQWIDQADDEWVGDHRVINPWEAVAVSSFDETSDTVTLAPDSLTASVFDESTAYPLKAPDSGSTYIMRTGADGDTGETLSDQMDALQTTYAVASTTISDGEINVYRGDSWSISITGLGTLTGYTSLWFTVKTSVGDTDAESILQVKLNSPSANDGLIYINGAAASDSTKASITVDDASAGNITIAVDETITDDIAIAQYVYDVQSLISGAVTTEATDTLTVNGDTTRSVT